ncbi:hypothetical protein E2562_017465 [Oryza meyeriana var. granulata]|uniref:Uncharacterized protein n=1 Tax=Oryza meyeriana var. granulata TaxID=110450 RepID=A0A6G1DXR3_9ORYZ|nr:hypothetical protein E2562_017465 [Oryza meyeriana var. granulata]
MVFGHVTEGLEKMPASLEEKSRVEAKFTTAAASGVHLHPLHQPRSQLSPGAGGGGHTCVCEGATNAVQVIVHDRARAVVADLGIGAKDDDDNDEVMASDSSSSSHSRGMPI